MTPPHNPGFGRPGSITGDKLAALPPQMQAEGLRLLVDMGEPLPAIRRRTGLPLLEIRRLLETPLPPFRWTEAAGEA